MQTTALMVAPEWAAESTELERPPADPEVKILKVHKFEVVVDVSEETCMCWVNT